MGVIYRARQRYSKRIVALKRILSYHGDSRETLEHFRREAEAAAAWIIRTSCRSMKWAKRKACRSSERGGEPLQRWAFQIGTLDQLSAALLKQEVARAMYQSIERDPAEAANAAPVDPGLAEDTVRELITAGRWLIDRGRASVADMDRAIESLQQAVQRQPGSATARAYLAMACLGRDVNLPDHEIAARALREAREAVRLAPRR